MLKIFSNLRLNELKSVYKNIMNKLQKTQKTQHLMEFRTGWLRIFAESLARIQHFQQR